MADEDKADKNDNAGTSGEVTYPAADDDDDEPVSCAMEEMGMERETPVFSGFGMPAGDKLHDTVADAVPASPEDGARHDELIHEVAENIPDEDTMCDIAELFKIFGDSTRIKILYALAGGDLAVNDIAALLSMSPSAISHQLRVLKQSRLIRYRRDGKSMIYSLSDDHVRGILNLGMEHVVE